MWIDIVAVLYIGFMTFLGYRQGMLKQILSLGAIVLVFVLAGPLASVTERFIPLGFIPNVMLAAILVYVVARIIFWLLNSQLGKKESGEVVPWNRNLGTALGMTKGILLAWLVACLLLTLLTAFQANFPTLHKSLSGSTTGRIAGVTNPLQPVMRFFELLKEYAKSPTMQQNVKRHPDVQRFLQDPQVQKVIHSEAVFARLRAIDSRMVRKAMKLLRILEEASTGKRAPPSPTPAPGQTPGAS